MRTVTVEVDVDLDDFDTEDLISELKARGETQAGEDSGFVESAYTSLLIGDCDEALELLAAALGPDGRRRCEARMGIARAIRAARERRAA